MNEGAAVLEVLAVGKGDMKLTFEEGDEDKARETIKDMLRRGYGIFVETDKGLQVVKRFNPKHMTYVITEVAPAEPGKSKRLKGTEREVPLAGSRAKVIGATAGG